MAPVILHHGLFGTDEIRFGPLRRSYWHNIDRAIAGRGHAVIATKVHPTASIETRARQLKQQILDRLEGIGQADRRVILIAHSMGGLDARYMVSKLGMARHVEAVITIATPHRGSSYADWIVRHLGDWGVLRMARRLGMDLGAGNDLMIAHCARFNEEVPNHPDVRYASINCVRPRHQMPAFAIHSHSIISAAEGENDGLVAATSAVWGTHLGTWPIDHWQAFNRHYTIRYRTVDVSKRYVEMLERFFAQNG